MSGSNFRHSPLAVILVALLVLFSFVGNVSTNQSLYIHPCGLDKECDNNRFLECDSLKNMCSCPKSLTWDHNVQSCRIKEYGVCRVHPHYSEFSQSNEKCVTNTTCESGRCRCQEGFLRNGFGICQLSYGKPCVISRDPGLSEQCASRFLLHCSPDSLTCKCFGEGSDYVWDENLQKCLSLVGSGCEDEESSSPHSDDKQECVDNAECVNKNCKCKQGYSSTPDGRCLLDYGEKCNNTAGQLCNKYKLLNCGDGTCGCELYGQMVFDSNAQKCRMLAGEICEVGVNISEDRRHTCIEDAECVPHPTNMGKGSCRCVEGKFKSADGHCLSVRSHGMACSYSGDCNQSEFLTCVISEVRGGICDCPENMFFDELTSSCLVYPGKSCILNPECGHNSYCKNGEYCDCKDGYSMSPSKRNQCFNATKNLDCSTFLKNSIEFASCNCSLYNETNVWSDIKRICLGLVGTSCKNDATCIDFALCDDDSMTCQCQKNAKTTTYKTCVVMSHHNHSGTGSPNDLLKIENHDGDDSGLKQTSDSDLNQENGIIKFNSIVSSASVLLIFNLKMYILILPIANFLVFH